MSIEYLNKKFAIGSWLSFSEIESGIALIKVDTAQATALICLMG
jgi:hypothetical protein